MSAGMSMAEWDRTGLISRETGYFRHLAERVGPISFLSYGHDPLKEEELLRQHFPGARIAWTLPRFFHWVPFGLFLGSWLPPLFPDHFRSCRLIRSHQLSGAWTGSLLAARIRVPFILRCGFLFSEQFAREHTSLVLRRLFFLLEGQVARHADAVIVTYPGARDFFRTRHLVPEQKIHVLGNPIDTDIFKPLIAEKSRDVVTVGRLSDQKNLFSLIRAVHACGLSLTIIGEGPLEQRLEEYIHDLKADVTLVQPVPNRTIPEILARHRMFVFPTFYEGNPKALIEAMACGMACIASSIPENRNLIIDGSHGLLCSTGHEDIARCIRLLDNEPALMERFGSAARERIIHEYSMDNIAERELAIHRSLLGEQS